MELKLLILRSEEPDRLAAFYRVLGMHFDHHRHGNGPMHYTTSIGKTTLEIYPLAKSQVAVDPHLRLGFEIDRFEEVMTNLRQEDIQWQAAPAMTEFGFMAVVVDPDGRKLELYRK